MSKEFPIGVSRNNPLAKSIFVEDFSDNGNVPPPPTQVFWVEDTSGNQMVTPSGADYIFVQ